MIQKDAVELCDFIKNTVDNPFSCDMLASKEGAQRKMIGIFQCIERLFELMEMIESEFEVGSELAEEPALKPMESMMYKPSLKNDSGSIGSSSNLLKPKPAPNKFKITTPISKKDVGEETGFVVDNLSDSLNKMK